MKVSCSSTKQGFPATKSYLCQKGSLGAFQMVTCLYVWLSVYMISFCSCSLELLIFQLSYPEVWGVICKLYCLARQRENEFRSLKIQASEEVWKCLVLNVTDTHKGVWLLQAGVPRNTGKNVWFRVLLKSRRINILYLLKAMIIAIRLT